MLGGCTGTAVSEENDGRRNSHLWVAKEAGGLERCVDDAVVEACEHEGRAVGGEDVGDGIGCAVHVQAAAAREAALQVGVRLEDLCRSIQKQEAIRSNQKQSRLLEAVEE